MVPPPDAYGDPGGIVCATEVDCGPVVTGQIEETVRLPEYEAFCSLLDDT